MKKLILTLISLIPLTSVSMAATIKLHEISQEEKITLILEVLESNPEIQLEIENDSDLNKAVNQLIKNGFIVNGAEVKKGSGSESVGGR